MAAVPVQVAQPGPSSSEGSCSEGRFVGWRAGCGLTLASPVAQVVFLEKRVTELEKDTAANGEQHSRLKQENLQLVHR